MTALALFACLFILMFIGVPVAISLGLSSLLTILFFTNDSLASVALKMFESVSEHYTLLSIFFISFNRWCSPSSYRLRHRFCWSRSRWSGNGIGTGLYAVCGGIRFFTSNGSGYRFNRTGGYGA